MRQEKGIGISRRAQNVRLLTGGKKRCKILMDFLSKAETKKLFHDVGAVCFDMVFVERGVSVEKGVCVYPFNVVCAGTVLKENCVLYPFNFLTHCVVEKNAVVSGSTLTDSRVGAGTTVGPYAHVKESTVGKDCRIGNFVEVKKSALGNGTKAAHLSYVGDAQLGNRVNVGCGVVFANYDGNDKHLSIVGDGCLVGCNCNFVAPIRLGERCFVAAGTTLTESLPSETFAVGRPQTKRKKNRFSKRTKDEQG